MKHAKSLIVLIITILLSVSTFADQKTVHVKGYTKKDGTHVAAHERKAPKSSGGSATSGASSSAKKSDKKSGSNSTPSTTTRSSASTQPRDAKGRFVRSETAKHAFMKQTGYPTGRPGYIVDHIIALACGGADAPANMQWQTLAAAKAKDAVERRGCH